MNFENRFNQLERQNNRLKIILLGMGSVLFVMGIVLIFTIFFVIESRTDLVDKIEAQDVERATVRESEVGSLAINDVQPEIIQIKRFEVVGDDGEVVASLGSNKVGDGMVMTVNNKGEGYVQLHAIVKNDGEVTIYESKAQELALWGINEEIHGGISLTNGESVALLSDTSVESGND